MSNPATKQINFDSEGLPIPQSLAQSVKFDSEGLPVPQKKNSDSASETSGNGLSKHSDVVDGVDVKAEAAKFEQERNAQNANNNFGLPSFKELAAGQQSHSESTGSGINTKLEQQDILLHKDERAATKKANIDKAITNTAINSLKIKGIKPTAVQLNQEKQKYQKQLDNGDASFVLNTDGTPGLRRVTEGLENLVKGWHEAINTTNENDDFVAKMSTQQKVDYLNKHPEQVKASEYIGERPSGWGDITHFAGGAAPNLGKIIGGSLLGAGLIAAAPETGGVSLALAPTIIPILMTSRESAMNGAADEIKRSYSIIKRDNPHLSDVEAMEQAEHRAWAGGIGGVLTNAAMLSAGLKSPISAESKSLLANTYKHILKPSAQMAAISGVGTLAVQEEGNLEGVKTSQSDIAKNVAQSIKDAGESGLLLTSLIHGVPNIAKSVAKFILNKEGNIGEIKQTLQENEANGKVPEGTTDNVINDLNEFKQALNKTPNNIPPDVQASVAGLIQKRTNIEKEAADKDITAQAVYKPQIDAINQQIEDIQRTGKPLEHEIDEATGKPYKQPTYDEEAKAKIEDLADKISKGKRIEDAADLQAEANFPEELQKQLTRISKEEKSAQKDKENPNTDLSDNIDKYLKKNNDQKEAAKLKDTEIIPALKKAEPYIIDPKAQEDVSNVMQKINNADYINEKELDNAANHLYDLLDKHGSNKSFSNLIEPLINKIENYEFRTKSQTRTVTEKVPIETIRKPKSVNKSLSQWEGNTATITDKTGKTVKGVLHSQDGNYHLLDNEGNKIAAIGEKAITDRDISLPSREDVPIPIKVENGDVKSITLQLNKLNKDIGGTDPHKLITIDFKDPERALDYAIQLRAEQVGEIPDNVFEKKYQEIQKEISEEVPVNDLSKRASKNNENKTAEVSNTETQGSITNEGVNQIEQPTEEGQAENKPSELPIENTGTLQVDNNGEAISTKRVINEAKAREFNLPSVPIPKLGSDVEEIGKAKDRIDSGSSNPINIVSELLNNTPLEDKKISVNDRFDMQYYMLQLKQRSNELAKQMVANDEALAKDPNSQEAKDNFISLTQQSADHADNYINAVEANKIGSAIWGKSGNAMQIELSEQGQILQRVQRIKDWFGGDVPKVISDKLSEIQTNLDKANAKINDLQDKYSKLSIENEALKTKETENKSKTKRTSSDYKGERKNILEDVAKALKKARSETSATIIPYAKELVAISPHVFKLFKSYAAEGISKVDDIVSKIQQDLKEILPLISKGEIRAILAGEYKTPKVDVAKDSEYIKAQKVKANSMFMLRHLENVAMNSKKNLYMKSLDFILKWERTAIFAFNTSVFMKLNSAALYGSLLHKPIEMGIGKGVSKIFTRVAKSAPIEGNENLRSLAKFYGEFLNPVKFVKEAAKIYTKGESQLTQELSTKHVGTNQYVYKNPIREKGIVNKAKAVLGYIKPVLEVYTNTHAVIKDPVKRATFESSMINNLEWNKKNGMDITHPLILESARQYSYKRAEYEIFQENNKLSGKINSFFNELEKSGILENKIGDLHSKIVGNAKYTASALYHFLVPISSVAINITRRVGLGVALPINIAKAIGMEQGIKELEPEKADLILRQLKKGAVGAAYWTLGFYLYQNAGGIWNRFDPDKKKGNRLKSGHLNIGGIEIPKEVQHTTQLQALQYGATARNVYNHYKDGLGKDTFDAIEASVFATLSGIVDGIPPAKEIVKLGEGIQDPNQLKSIVKDVKRSVGINKMQDLGILPADAKPSGGGGGATGNPYDFKDSKMHDYKDPTFK